MTLNDPDMVALNKKIFYDRITSLVNNIEEAVKKRKTLLEAGEKKATESKKQATIGN